MVIGWTKNTVVNIVVLSLLLCIMCSKYGFAQTEYILGEGDLLRITVYDHPDMTTEARIGGDGTITMPLIGVVKVDSLTITDAEKYISHLLADGFIIKPHVAIFVSEYRSRRVTVLGEVGRPGIVILRGDKTLLEVISDAGGLTPNAGDFIHIQRKKIRQDGSKKEQEEITVQVDTKKLMEEGSSSINIFVQDGDSIFIPRAAFVFIYGEIKNPGAFKISKSLTVLKAITLAGGFTPKASERRTKILRKTDKGEVTLAANMNDLVQPDDVIYVPESFF